MEHAVVTGTVTTPQDFENNIIINNKKNNEIYLALENSVAEEHY